MGIQKDVLVWSAADLSASPTVGSTFTVTGAPDLMSFKDDESSVFPGDFDPAVPSTIEPNQTLSGTLDGVEFTGNNATTDVFEFEVAFQVTDGLNTFNIYRIDNDQYGGTTVAYVSEVALDPGATYTVLAEDDGVNFDNGTGYETTPVWDDLAGQVDGTSGDDTIGAGYVDDDDDRVGGNDGDSDVILGEGGGDTISSGAGDDVIYGDHVDDLPAGTTEYIAQGFFRDVNFELESGSFNFGDTSVSISGTPLEIRFIDNDGVLNGDTASSETPDDTDQRVEINGVLYNYSADYVIQMSGSDGQTYDMLVIDVDRDSSGGIDLYDPTSDPGDVDYENGQILIPRGAVPPTGVTLTAFDPSYDLVNENYSALNGAAVVTNYDDSVDAGWGDDTVCGGQGDDTLIGGADDDSVDGGAGDDLIYSGTRNMPGAYSEQTGTSDNFTGTNGNSDFTGTTTSNEGQVSTFSNAGLSGYWLGNGDGDETHTHSFSQEIAGVRIDFNAINSGEYLTFEIDSVAVDLNTLIANGDAIFDGANAYGIDGSGRIIETGPDSNATTGSVTFLRPLTDIDVISSVDTFGSGFVYEMHVDTNPPTYSDDDVLSGGDGSDRFIIENAFGNDTITGGEDVGDTDIDVLDASGITTGGVTVTSTNEAGSLSEGPDTVSFSEIESFTLTDQDDTFIAWGTSDVTVDAGGGNDTLQGGSGTNSLSGGDGDDVFEVGIGTDSLDGGAGTDTLSAVESDDPISVTFAGTGFGTYDDISDSDSGTFTSIEAVDGSSGADIINAAADSGGVQLSGNGGDDTITGGAGDDTIDGGAGADSLTGGAGADEFIVDDGGDTITDFDPTTGVDGGGTADNDYVDLSAYYNQTTLDAWNLANPGTQYDTPLGWLRADQDDNGNLGQVGGLRILGIDDQPVASSELQAENTGVVCFTKGTCIATERGEIPVEDLEVGDLVQTMDHGLQPIRWIGARHLSNADLIENPNLQPIRISTTVMGLPEHDRDLVVSPQHRILVSSKIAQRMIGEGEILIAAKKMLDLDGVDISRGGSGVTYYHVLCDAHEILFANGIPAESLYLGKEALKSLSPEGLAEIRALFPELVAEDIMPRPCRKFVSGSRAKTLCRRHAKNHQPLREYGVHMRLDIEPNGLVDTAATASSH